MRLPRVSQIAITVIALFAAAPTFAQTAQVSLSGRVLDRNGAGVPQVALALILTGTGSSVSTYTNSDGQYSLEVTPGRYRLSVSGSRPGGSAVPYWYSLLQDEPFDLTTSRTGADIALPFKAVHLRVQDPSGQPVSGASLQADGVSCAGAWLLGMNSSGWSYESHVMTDGSGEATLWLLPTPSDGSARYTIVANASSGSGMALTATALTDDASLALTLQAAVTLAGRVLDRDGTGVQGVSLSLSASSDGPKVSALTNSQGQYSLQVPAGRYRLRVSAVSGIKTDPREVPYEYSLSLSQDLDLNASRSGADISLPFKALQVRVQDPSGNPVSGASLNTDSPPCTGTWLLGLDSSGSSREWRVTTDASGGATLWLLPTPSADWARYTIVATPPLGRGLSPTSLEGIELTDDRSVALTLQPSVTLSGRVLDPSGAGVRAASVSLTSNQRLTASAETNSEGQYSFDVTPGQYRLGVAGMRTAVQMAYQYSLSQHPELDLSAGRSGADITLPFKSLRVRVQDPSGNPVGRTSLRTDSPSSSGPWLLGLDSTGWSYGYGVTDESGDATLWLLPTQSPCGTPPCYWAYTITATPPSGSGMGKTTLPDVELMDDRSLVLTLQADDNALPAVSINDVSALEGALAATFTVSLSDPGIRPVTLGFATADGSAVSATDYAVSSGTLSFAPGELTKTVTVNLLSDALDEDDESFFVTLSGVTNARVADAQGAGTIRNDDDPTVSAVCPPAAEGTGAGVSTATCTVSLSHASLRESVTVAYGTSNGTASSADYASASGVLTFAAGETAAQQVAIAITRDALDEADETFTFAPGNPTNATVAGGSAGVTITDDDEAPSLSASDCSVVEGTAGVVPCTMAVALSAASGKMVSVGYASAKGTASAGSDFVSASGTLSFAPGEVAKSIAVSVNGDTTDEEDETFTVSLSAPVNASLLAAKAVGTIVDDDAEPSVSVSDVSVTEGNPAGTANVEGLQLCAPDSMPVYLETESFENGPGNWATVALRGDNPWRRSERLAADGTWSFEGRTDLYSFDSSLQMVKSVAIPTGDVRMQFAHSFDFEQDGSQSWDGGVIEFGGVENLPWQSAAAVLSGGTRYTGTLSQGHDNPLAGRDAFVGTSNGLTHTQLKLSGLAGRNLRFRFRLGADSVASGNKGWLIDDVRIYQCVPTQARFAVSLQAPSAKTVDVSYATSDGTALAGSDYKATSGQVTFQPGETVKTLAVPIVNDTFAEPDEGFVLTVTAASNATIADGQGWATVHDNDRTRPARGTDFNGDGKADILWRHDVTGTLYLWQMNGVAATAITYVDQVPDLSWQIVGTGDYDGDTKADILWHNQATGEVYLWQMDGATVLAKKSVSSVADMAWKVVGSRDYDGDGKADILWRHDVTGVLYLWQMNGVAATAITYVDQVPDPNWRIVGTGDYDGNRKADILWHNQATGEVQLWQMNGPVRAATTQVGSVSDLGWKVAGQGDYNGDGTFDVLWRHDSSGAVYVWLMNGAVATATYVNQVDDPRWNVVGGGDYDGDGKSDVLWHHSLDGRLDLWKMDGATMTPFSSIARVDDVGWQVVNTK